MQDYLSDYGWLGFAVAAALLWGLQYALWGGLVKTMTPTAALFWYGVLCVLLYGGLLLWQGQGFETAAMHAAPVLWTLIGVAVLGVLANVLMMTGFRMKNATVVSMIQVSYPLMTAVFGWLLYRNVQLNGVMLAGFTCVVVGVGLIAVSQE